MKKKILLPIFASFMFFTGIGIHDAQAATYTDITNTAKAYIGTPYKYGGTDIKTGIDCSAYTQLVFSKVGISLERTSNAQYQQGTSIAKDNLKTGDLVFFNTSGSGVSHVGIYIGDSNFISATTSSGVKMDKINDPYYWGSRYVGAKRVASFSDYGEVKDAEIDFTIYSSRGEVALKIAKKLQLDTSQTNSSFPDVKPGSKYAGAAEALKKIGVFTGDENGKFNPGSPITRGQLSKVLVEAFHLKQQGATENFLDVPGAHWANSYVSILASNKITVGKGDNLFGVNDYVTIEHLDAFIQRLTQ
ncbi:C40 family peptidase [Lysinibacillus sphaericus]|uniref:Gamma-DL-glutamyl hydrolase n=3 Tax=Lysinibacillus TaxID=400634 RepID=B1HNB1_LYSSC|nr:MULTISPECIES: C40 family peptidase [Lysinibacillus]MBE5083411.1 C40 family peptidase [Bacillus thuringiensis]ACA40421.1 Gamma-DL-glutamyl hydrolase precursor [Lysinibacillus sphaericus C3-41]AMO33559.1 peptidase [Lysinibacillus sphaericus]AMR91334.1 peptidase [Lysinibacillus sphaericus]ANA45382.1 peptidase [Lysinibacillus sphaericus]